MPDKEFRKKEHERSTSDFTDAMRDLIRAQEVAYEANINDINTWINTLKDSVEPCNVDLADIANISTRITEMAKSIPNVKHQLGTSVTNKLYARIEQAETNLMDTISEINAKCIIRKR